MPLPDTTFWTDRLQQTLRCYEEDLLRQVAGKLCRTRSQWPVPELIERCLALVNNPAGLDRRLKDLEPACRRALAVIGHSRQPRWAVGNLVEILLALGETDGLQPLLTLLEAGLLYPDLTGQVKKSFKDFTLWLSQGTPSQLVVFAHPSVSGRVLSEDLRLPACPDVTSLSGPKVVVHEADGLEWPLRLAVLWQQVVAAPLRRTQQGDFFKRDLDRLRNDPLLSAASVDSLAELPDLAPLAVALAVVENILLDQDGELHAGDFPAVWQESLAATLASLWVVFLQLDTWNSEDGWQIGQKVGNPFPSAYLLALLLLSGLPENSWADPHAVEQTVFANHPYWGAVAGRIHGADQGKPNYSILSSFLLGIAYQLRLVQAARDENGQWRVRLSPLGRWVLSFGPLPPPPPMFPQTLLVQPNLEILAYRQGLTPTLIARLSRFAAWKGLSTACTLQLQPDTVYRALEGGETFESLLQTLEKHGMKATPMPVIDSLRTWSNKRERLQVYPSAALFEFASPEDLADALARGLPATRLTDRLAVVANEQAIDYRHFRLAGTRDYGLPLEKCVEVEPDGVTLRVDLVKSDLLLETELQRFAELLPRQTVSGRRLYCLTPASLAKARQGGLSLSALESWISQRTGSTLSPAARLLFNSADLGPLAGQRLLVLRVPAVEVADGLEQWPETRPLIQERLGPLALVVAEDNCEALREQLKALGIDFSWTAPG